MGWKMAVIITMKTWNL